MPLQLISIDVAILFYCLNMKRYIPNFEISKIQVFHASFKQNFTVNIPEKRAYNHSNFIIPHTRAEPARAIQEPYMVLWSNRGFHKKKREKERIVDAFAIRFKFNSQLNSDRRKKDTAGPCFIRLATNTSPLLLVHVRRVSTLVHACACVPNKTRLVRYPSIEFECLRSIHGRGALHKKQELL